MFVLVFIYFPVKIKLVSNFLCLKRSVITFVSILYSVLIRQKGELHHCCHCLALFATCSQFGTVAIVHVNIQFFWRFMTPIPLLSTLTSDFLSTTQTGDSLDSSVGFCTKEVNDRIRSAGNTIHQVATNLSRAVIPLGSIGIATNLFLSVLILRQIIRGGGVKRYLFLFSRAVSDAITCLSLVIIVAHRRHHPLEGKTVTAEDKKTKIFLPYGTQVLGAFVQFNFWTLCSTYALLSLITFIAVRFPFFHRSRLNARFCCILLLVSIVLGICYSIVSVVLGTVPPFITLTWEDPKSLLDFPTGPNAMKIAIGDTVVILFLWVFVFALYVVVLILLIRLRRQDIVFRTYLNRFLRMSLSILLWTIICAFMVAAVLTPPLWNYRSKKFIESKETQVDTVCEHLASIASSLRDLIVSSVAAETFWLARFVFDPFLCVCFDANLRAFWSMGLKRLRTFHYSVQKSL